MLKTVSSIANAIGALNYKGTWDANANVPPLASGVGTKGDYYVVGTAGSTTLDGISNWGIGDWAVFNGSVWQRVEGGANLNGVDLSVSGTSTLSALTASTALALNASKNIVSVTNTGTGDNVLATAPTLVGDVSLSTGNLVVSNGKGIDFSLTPGTGTSELLDDYEEGTWTPTLVSDGGSITNGTNYGFYTKIGRQVTLTIEATAASVSSPSGDLYIFTLPFVKDTATGAASAISVSPFSLAVTAITMICGTVGPTYLIIRKYSAGANSSLAGDIQNGSAFVITATYFV